MQPKHSKYVLWLLFDFPSNEQLKAYIDRFSERFSTPKFVPHITLGRVPEKSLKELKQLAADLSKKFTGFPTSLGSPECGNVAFQRFTAPVENPFKVIELSNKFDEICGGEFGKKEDLHVSLLYGEIDCKKLYQFYNSLEFKMPEHLYVQSIGLVDVSQEVGLWDIKYQAELKYVSQ